MENNDWQFNYHVKIAQSSEDRAEKKKAIEIILEKLRPFRFALAKRFSNKGVEFEDITQQIDLKIIEAIHDYDEKKDPSALRHLVSKTRNGIWNFYRKEMNYFDDKKVTISLDSIYGVDGNYCGITDSDNESFDEEAILEKIMVEEELTKLTPRQREILFMCFVDDMTQYDIAEELNINQANVSRAKNRGINNIKNKINPSDEQSEIL